METKPTKTKATHRLVNEIVWLQEGLYLTWSEMALLDWICLGSSVNEAATKVGYSVRYAEAKLQEARRRNSITGRRLLHLYIPIYCRRTFKLKLGRLVLL